MKVKLPVYVIKYHIVNAYGVWEVKRHAFLIYNLGDINYFCAPVKTRSSVSHCTEDYSATVLKYNLVSAITVIWCNLLRCCATNQKVAGSIPAGVSGFFIDIKSFRSHYGPAVDSAFNRNEYQEYFLGVKAAGT